jgi:hypothetical protein
MFCENFNLFDLILKKRQEDSHFRYKTKIFEETCFEPEFEK